MLTTAHFTKKKNALRLITAARGRVKGGTSPSKRAKIGGTEKRATKRSQQFFVITNPVVCRNTSTQLKKKKKTTPYWYIHQTLLPNAKT